MTMRYALAAAFAVVLGAGLNASDPVLSGDYVEARTAEVFTGGCIMGSEGEVSGREALMAWRVREGSLNGVSLNGLSVVAMVAADVNLGTHELGGAAPVSIRTMLMVDARANAAQQQALVEMARALAPDVVRDVASTRSTPIVFEADAHTVRVSAGAANLDVVTHAEHSPECGALKWFEPLARISDAQVGLTRTFEWSGSGLGAQWTQIDRRSSFVGSFSLGR
jgi:hypothetical protein